MLDLIYCHWLFINQCTKVAKISFSRTHKLTKTTYCLFSLWGRSWPSLRSVRRCTAFYPSVLCQPVEWNYALDVRITRIMSGGPKLIWQTICLQNCVQYQIFLSNYKAVWLITFCWNEYVCASFFSHHWRTKTCNVQRFISNKSDLSASSVDRELLFILKHLLFSLWHFSTEFCCELSHFVRALCYLSLARHFTSSLLFLGACTKTYLSHSTSKSSNSFPSKIFRNSFELCAESRVSFSHCKLPGTKNRTTTRK